MRTAEDLGLIREDRITIQSRAAAVWKAFFGHANQVTGGEDQDPTHCQDTDRDG
ncbi:hypothetical protein H2248_002648 [Termitomyces sp. 'cryptogamus']|nr:hypothetical protein H2248_002648 [Termitomyces sp. 'cryptogamus']